MRIIMTGTNGPDPLLSSPATRKNVLPPDNTMTIPCTCNKRAFSLQRGTYTCTVLWENCQNLRSFQEEIYQDNEIRWRSNETQLAHTLPMIQLGTTHLPVNEKTLVGGPNHISLHRTSPLSTYC